MEAVGAVLSVAQTIFAALQCSELKQVCSMFGYDSELEKLGETVSAIKAVLLDAEAKQGQLSHQEQLWVEKLKDALYDADDLLDEFATLARQQQQLLEGDDQVSKKEQVRSWFSLSPLKKMNDALNMSLGVQGIRKKLDGIASDYSKFGFKVDYEPIRRRREETCSYVYEESVIGREDDRKFVVDTLLDPSKVEDRDVSFLNIVGVGGLGKTTLAQLVYNDERVKANFSLRLWACVGDQDDEQLDVKGILGKILNSATGGNYDGSGLEWVQGRFQELISGRKYLLVLDDVWSENPVELRKLAGFLTGGQRGSWVVVTTRSKETARSIGNGHPYELKGLSEAHSWHLFEMSAFGERQEPPKGELVKIGKKIVGKCAGVPLAIRVVGSLLYGQEKRMWLSYQNDGIAYTGQGNNDIMQDFIMNKDTLIRIWMAHGCVVPFDKGQDIEEAAEEHFSILLRRCFFQDVKRDDSGEITSCKVHDLMHDIAQEVAGKEIFVADSITSKLYNKVCHLSLIEGECAESFITKMKLRTYLYACDCFYYQKIPVGTVLACWVCVRVLDLRAANIESLPETIGKLVHLRYLDLSFNYWLAMLPQSITKSYNLQTLLLNSCFMLRELPNDLSKLVQLRALGLEDCRGLTRMPSSMKELTCLRILTAFVVGSRNSNFEQFVVSLEALRGLTNLKGCLNLIYFNKIDGVSTYDKEKARRGEYLKGMQHLKNINLYFEDGDDDVSGNYTEALVEGLEPHPNVQALTLDGYNMASVPSWTERLTNLVTICFSSCHRLRHLPPMGKLPHLRILCLSRMRNMEWVENSSALDSASSEQESLFPSPEHLTLDNLPKLKGWWKSEVGVADDQLHDSSISSCFPPPSFPRLSRLSVWNCPHLISIPLCPNLEELKLKVFNESLCPIMTKNNRDICRNLGNSKLRSVCISNAGYLNSLPLEAFQCLTEMEITGDGKLESLSEVGEVFRSCSSSLRSLRIIGCIKLRSLTGGGGLEFLTALESLSIKHAENLDLESWWSVEQEEEDYLTALKYLFLDVADNNLEIVEDEEDGNGIMPWRSLQHTLRSLTLWFLPKLVELPKGMHHLTSLQSLEIQDCQNLKCLPEWGSCFSSLQYLRLHYCENLQGLPEWVCRSSSLSLEIE